MFLRNPVRSSVRYPSRSPVSGGRGGNTLPPGAIFSTVNGIDVIGISIADKPNVRAEIWALLFDENDAPYTDEQRITNFEASDITNNGWELGGNSTRGWFLYPEGTDESILRRAYRWAGEIYPEDSGADFDASLVSELDSMTVAEIDALNI